MNTRSENTRNTSDTTLKKPTKIVYTPLELQFLELKKQYKDAILCIECGYKYRFFGDDAEVRFFSKWHYVIAVTNIVHNYWKAYVQKDKIWYFINFQVGQEL